MNRLWTLAAICGATFVIVIGSMAATSTPARAQSGKVQDVRVTNTNSQSVPVAVQGTPTVNVGNNLTISSLPAVQIGNNANAPVPVTVQNLPAGADGREPINISATMTVYDNGYNSSAIAYAVPQGKRLTIETLSGIAFSTKGSDAKHRFTVSVGIDADAPKYYLQMDDVMDDPLYQTQTGTKSVGIHAEPGKEIGFYIFRDKTIGSTGTDHFGMTLTASGYLEDVPSS